MIATCNIKVNGRWIRAGESYELPEEKTARKKPVKEEPEIPAEEKKAEEKPAAEEKPKAEPKPRTTTRRKTTK